MKILLRRWRGEDYIWRTAKYDNSGFKVDDLNVDYTNIVSVANDNRKNYVRCAACGAVIKNNSSEIEKHKSRHLTSDACLTCSWLRKDQGNVLSTKYIKQSDGSYVEKVKREVVLRCNADWLVRNIDDSETRDRCLFKICAQANMEPITDIFTRMPGLFDNMATVNTIVKIGYDAKESYEANMYKHYRLNIKLDDYAVYAVVNILGIIDHFLLIDGWDETKVYYSKKFDKLFRITNGEYAEFEVYFENELKAEIRKLYN